MRTFMITGLSIVALAMGTGCAGTTIQPGHRALFFDPGNGGIQAEVLQPGWKRLACPFYTPENKCPRVDDFDVTYSTNKELIHTLSSEGLALDLNIAVSYRPIVSELYQLDTEIGPNYFDEVVGPEFRSAAIGVFAHTSYTDLQRKNGSIEDEVEKQLRERLRGKHVEISSILIEKVTYAPEVLASLRERVVSQEQTLRNKQLMENEAAQKKVQLELTAQTKKLELETASAQKEMELKTESAQKKMELAAQTEQKRLELQAEAEQSKFAATTKMEVDKIQILQQTDEDKFRIDSNLRNKQAEKRLTMVQSQIDRMKAEGEADTHIAQAKGEASARTALAKASAEEVKATVANVTPMQVMMHAYDALGHLGGSGTTFMLGDWSKVPQFLFPKVPAFQSMFNNPWQTWPGNPNLINPPMQGGAKVSQNAENPYP